MTRPIGALAGVLRWALQDDGEAKSLDTAQPFAPNPFTPSRANPVLEAAGIGAVDAAAIAAGPTPEEAVAIANRLLEPPSLQQFGPRAVVLSVLMQIGRMDRAPTKDEVRAMFEAHDGLAIVRPDGYLASARTGRAIQKLGEPKLDGERFEAGDLEIGRFYRLDGGCVRDGDTIVYELSLEHDRINKVIDGGEDALIGMIMSTGRSIEDPVQAVLDLLHLPIAIVDLVRHSPELVERFRAMPPGDQIRAASHLLGTVLMIRAAASSIPRAGGIGTDAIGSLGTESVLQLRLQLSVAGVAIGVVATGGTVAVVHGIGEQLAEQVELSDVAKAGLKRARRCLSEEGAQQARRELRKLAAQQKRVLEMLDRLMADPTLPQNARAALRTARNALCDHLTPEDLIGALRDRLGIPVRTRGDGRAFQHIEEVTNALDSLTEARNALLRRGERAGLSEEIGAISDLLRRMRAFLEIR